MSAQRQEHLRGCLDTMTKLLDTHMSLVNTCMVDFAMDVHKSLYPDQEVPPTLVDKRASVCASKWLIEHRVFDILKRYL